MELHDSESGAFSRRGYAAPSPGVAAGAKPWGIPGITKSSSVKSDAEGLADPTQPRSGYDRVETYYQQ